jgi:3-methyl-2-oxobutanoate hydroxymethyltransferase
MNKKLTNLDLLRMKKTGKIVAWLTAYDYLTAQLAEQAKIDMLLVGDSMGMIVYGYDSTVPVTMDQCIQNCQAVRRGAPNTFIIGDMPFGSYQTGVRDAVKNAVRFYKEAGTDCLKLEGGKNVVPVIRAISENGMLIMGHVGLTPQSSGTLGGFKAQGRTAESAMAIIEDAWAVYNAGAFAVLLEAVPAEITKTLAHELPIPVYGIGAGMCDGQTMVNMDLLGMFSNFHPKFSKRYANLGEQCVQAFEAYRQDVKEGRFPEEKHTYKMLEGESEKFSDRLLKRATK